MFSLRRLIPQACFIRASILSSQLVSNGEKLSLIASQHFARKTSNRFLDLYQFVNKEAMEKERARITDEMNRGYFADISDLKKHGGKISMANKVLIPAIAAAKFPDFEVTEHDGKTLKLPIRFDGSVGDNKNVVFHKASLLCLSFRASSQTMIESWSVPFLDAFTNSKDAQLYDISFIDSRFLSWYPMKRLLLRKIRKTKNDGEKNALEKQIVYSFGDHYDIRKELKILNLLTGYMFLLDKFGRIRWQSTGVATKEELTSLLSCTSHLLDEQ